MPPINVIFVHKDPALLQSLIRSSDEHFLHLATVPSAQALREAVARLRAQMAIVDLEAVSFSELRELCHEFPATAFVSIHRLADDLMWTQSLAAGAVDCCTTGDVSRILGASERYVAIKAARAFTAA